MALALECVNCGNESFDCCSGGSTNELFEGLKVTESPSGDVTKLHKPFRVLYDVDTVYLSDALKNRFNVPLADTVYSNMDDLLTFIRACKCAGVIPSGKYNSNSEAIAAGLIPSVDHYYAGSNHLDGHLEDVIVRVY